MIRILMAGLTRIETRMGLLVALLFFSGGCTFTHSAYLSDQWIEHPHGLRSASLTQSQPTLQIIISYDGPLSSHAALRLVGPQGNVTFWDPAGAYGLRSFDTEPSSPANKPKILRKNDLVVSAIPDLPTYIRFRWNVGDISVEVFEWDVSSQDARRLEDILHEGTKEGARFQGFETETAPAFCTVAISEFLQRFAKPILTISDWYLWPHNLAEALLEQRPSRIRVYLPNQRESIYVAPHHTTHHVPSGAAPIIP